MFGFRFSLKINHTIVITVRFSRKLLLFITYQPYLKKNNPTSCVLAPHDNPLLSLGTPDHANDNGYTSLGDEGSLVVKFTDNSLTTSGDATKDLWIFEIGGAVEQSNIAISTNGIDWIDLGPLNGGTRGIDIDAFIGSGVTLGARYSYVQIVDLLPHQSGSPFAGADIDAIGAATSAAPAAVPVPAAMWLFGSGLLGLVGVASRKKA